MADEKTRRIARLNDKFRQYGQGHGRLMITQGVNAEGSDFVLRVHQAVANFKDFTPDNDPYGEHDFGSLKIDGQKIFWKFDYYDPSLKFGSEDPSDESKTCRVLTIMLASEY